MDKDEDKLNMLPTGCVDTEPQTEDLKRRSGYTFLEEHLSTDEKAGWLR
jgi:hypothetical protein